MARLGSQCAISSQGILAFSLLDGESRRAPVMHCGPAEAGTAHGTDSVTVRFIRQLVELEAHAAL